MNDDVAPRVVSKSHSRELTMLYSPHSNVPSILLAPMVVVDLQELQPLQLM
jgi:hypothetical protein